MSVEEFRPLLYMAMRYGIAGLGAWLISIGVTDADAASAVDQIATIVSGAVIYFAPQIYAALKRPSVKAMETAKAVDREIPKDEPVVLLTPAGQPDIVVPVHKGGT